MPTTYTHYRFGKDVLKGLPKPLQQQIEMHRDLFNIGLHGPDILFYYRFFQKNHVNQQGFQLHDLYADAFFEHAIEAVEKAKDKGAARAYIYGVICHFALDSECHPYVEKMIQTSGISHSEIEMELDRWLLTKDHIEPVTHYGTSHIHPTRKNGEVIAPFYENITPEELEHSLTWMNWVHKGLLAPGKAKRNLLFGGMKLIGLYESGKGMVMSLEPNPACERFCQILEGQYEGALPVARDLILSYQKVLFEKKPLPERFHETFGAGEHWEEIEL